MTALLFVLFAQFSFSSDVENQCYKDICSNAEFNLHTHINAQWEKANQYMEEGAVNIVTAMNTIVDQRIAQELKNISDIEKLMANPAFRLSPDKKVLHNLFFTFLIMNDIEMEFVEGSDTVNFAVNVPVTAANLSYLSPTLKSYALQIAELVAKLPSKEIIEGMQLPSEIFLGRYYPKHSFGEAIKTVAQETENMLVRLSQDKETSPIKGMQSFISDFRTINHRAAINGRPISAKAMNEVIRGNAQMKLVMTVAFGEDYRKLAETFPQNEYINQIRNSSAALVETKLLTDKVALDSVKQELLYQCIAIYGSNMAMLPTKEELARGQSAEKLVKYLFTRTLRKYPEQTQIELVKTMNEWHFVYPPMPDAFKIDFLNGLKMAMDESYSWFRLTMDRNLKDPQWADILPFLSRSFLGKSDSTVEQKVEDLFDTCDSYYYPPLNDAAYTSHGGILISWATLKDPNLFRGVVAHELGHVVEVQLSRLESSTNLVSKFTEAKQCLMISDRHPELPEDKSGKYFKEDWADLILAEMTGPNSPNPWCALMEAGDEELSLINETPHDTHSSNFYRLMHIEVARGKKLPASCSTVAMEATFKNCFGK